MTTHKYRIIKNEGNFTTFLNRVLQNLKNFEALGLYCYLSSLPHDWTFHKSHLREHGQIGIHKFNNLLKILEKHALVKCVQIRDAQGRFAHFDLEVSDGSSFIINELESSVQPCYKNRITETVRTEISTYKRNIYKTNNEKENINNILCTSDEMHASPDDDLCENDDNEKSDYEVNHEERADIDVQLVEVNLNPTKSDYHKNQTKKRSDCKLYAIDNHKLIQINCPEESNNRFEEFWALYPVKKNKIRSKKYWDKKKLYKIATLICTDVQNRMNNDFYWQKKQFIPHPSTYLNDELWNDEIIKPCLPKTHQWTVDTVMGA